MTVDVALRLPDRSLEPLLAELEAMQAEAARFFDSVDAELAAALAAANRGRGDDERRLLAELGELRSSIAELLRASATPPATSAVAAEPAVPSAPAVPSVHSTRGAQRRRRRR